MITLRGNTRSVQEAKRFQKRYQGSVIGGGKTQISQMLSCKTWWSFAIGDFFEKLGQLAEDLDIDVS